MNSVIEDNPNSGTTDLAEVTQIHCIRINIY